MTTATAGPPGAIRALKLQRACDLVIGSPSKYATPTQRQAARLIVGDRARELFRRDLPALSLADWNALIDDLEVRYGAAS